MKTLIHSDWFHMIDLTLALCCALAWAIFPQWGWIFLIVSFFPWAMRLVSGQFPFRRSSFDILIAVFLLTAGIGVWASYDKTAAWEKFFWIVAAIRLYYAFAGQPYHNQRWAAILLTAPAALVSLLFLMTYDWLSHPLMAPIDRIGASWMALRPNPKLPVPEPDFVGGLAAMLFPLLLVLVLDFYKKGNKRELGLMLLIGVCLVLGLLMSAELPAWLGLVLAAGLWLGWQACCQLAQRTGRKAITFAGLGLLLLSLAGIFLGVIIWQRYTNHGLVPGRVEEIINGTHLALEYPIIGGGLTATPGLYSRYMLGIPFLYIPNIRNQYLNISIEQGVFGLVAVTLIFAGALIQLSRSTENSESPWDFLNHYKWALALGILLLAWHSLMEDIFYSNWGLVLLLSLPGLAASLLETHRPKHFSIIQKWWMIGLGTAVILLIVFFRPLLALWNANLGAVEMAQVQLKGWPDKFITSEQLLSNIEPAETHFEQAVHLSASQPAANYRLGLITNERRDFEIANQHLETAYQLRPYHRGVQKALGYSYVWMGDIDTAGQTLSTIPEAAYELNIYAQWWESENRSDLSEYAAQTEILLGHK